MNERIQELAKQAHIWVIDNTDYPPSSHIPPEFMEKFAKLIVSDMRKKVIASILITDVVMEEKGLTPTSEDYISAINKDFEVEE